MFSEELFNSEYITLFHGTTSAEKDSLRDILLEKCTPCTDFGQGFYTTTRYKQALRWATLKTNKKNYTIDRINRKKDRGNKLNKVSPLVKAYCIKYEDYSKFLIKCYTQPGEEWKDFIYKCRIDEHKHEYDIVYGPLGDTGIAQLIQDVKDGIINYNQFIQQININSDYPLDDQISFHSVAVLTVLKDLGEVYNDAHAERLQSQYETQYNN